MSHRRHRKFGGRPGHNGDLIQANRFLNQEAQKQNETKKRQKDKTYPSVSELMKSSKK